MRACAFCAKVKFSCSRASSTNYNNFVKICPPPNLDGPPAAFSNVILYDYMTSDDGRWNVCHACKSVAKRAVRLRHLGIFHPDYITNLPKGDPTHPLMLSVVHCNDRFSDRVVSFLHTSNPQSPYLLRGPLVHWAKSSPVMSVAELP
jgi:hypothetical protein